MINFMLFDNSILSAVCVTELIYFLSMIGTTPFLKLAIF